MANPNPKTKFTKGSPIARLAGQKSRRNLPAEIKESRLMNANDFEQTIYKYMHTDILELKKILTEAARKPEQITEQEPYLRTPAIDLLVIKIITEAIGKGDYQRLNFLLERTIGKVIDKSQVDVRVGIQTLHDEIMSNIREANKLNGD